MVAQTEIEPEFVDAFTYAATVSKIAQPQSGYPGAAASTRCFASDALQPLPQGITSSTGDVFSELPLSGFHAFRVIYKLQKGKRVAHAAGFLTFVPSFALLKSDTTILYET